MTPESPDVVRSTSGVPGGLSGIVSLPSSARRPLDALRARDQFKSRSLQILIAHNLRHIDELHSGALLKATRAIIEYAYNSVGAAFDWRQRFSAEPTRIFLADVRGCDRA